MPRRTRSRGGRNKRAQRQKRKPKPIAIPAEQAKQAEEYQAYVARIGLAAAQIDDNAFDTAEQLLNDCPPRLRNWEWGRLWHLSTQSVRDFRCHGASRLRGVRPPTAGDSSPAVGMARPAFGTWRRGKTLLTIPYGGLYVHAVAFLARRQLARHRRQRQARLCENLECAHRRFGADACRPYRRRALGRVLAGWPTSVDQLPTTRRPGCGMSKPATRLQRFLGHNWWVWSAAFSPDESRIVTASQDGTAIVWSTEPRARPGPPSRAMLGPVYAAAFSPDGNSVVSGGYDNRLLDLGPDELMPFNYQAVVSGGDESAAEVSCSGGAHRGHRRRGIFSQRPFDPQRRQRQHGQALGLRHRQG